MKSSKLLIVFGLPALLAGCASGGPMGGSAPNADAAETHCQKYGKHAEPNSIANNGNITFRCIGDNEKQPVKETSGK